MDVEDVGGKQDLRGRRVVVMGLGCFSGGVAAARFMARRGARVIVTDTATADKLANSIQSLHDVPIEAFRLGGHWEPDFQSADLVIANPAVREDNHFLSVARRHGALVTTEMNLFFELCRAPIVGITGSNGKSTTTALIHSMLRESGRTAWLGGNIGQSLIEQVDEIQPSDIVVLELSSFQLEDLDEISKSPRIAVVTTFTPNHLDRHPSMDAYRTAKQAILRHQLTDDLAILNADDPDVRSWKTYCRTIYYGLDDHGHDGTFLDRDRLVIRQHGSETEFNLIEVLRIPGLHNVSNAAGATCCAAALGVGIPAIQSALASFKTLPHRLELVCEIAGRRFFDDSIATTPESTLAALDSLTAPIWLIAGGHDKGSDLTQVAQRIAERAAGVALLGQTAATLRLLISRFGSPDRPRLCDCSSMEQAVQWCFEQSTAGDAVLLSPACASFGMFQNFVDRANVFRRAAEGLRWVERKAG